MSVDLPAYPGAEVLMISSVLGWLHDADWGCQGWPHSRRQPVAGVAQQRAVAAAWSDPDHATGPHQHQWGKGRHCTATDRHILRAWCESAVFTLLTQRIAVCTISWSCNLTSWRPPTCVTDPVMGWNDWLWWGGIDRSFGDQRSCAPVLSSICASDEILNAKKIFQCRVQFHQEFLVQFAVICWHALVS